MKIPEIIFNGIERNDLDKSKFSDENLTLLHSFQVGQMARDKAQKHQIRFEEDQVIEFIFDDDTTWIANPDTIDDLFPELLKTSKRAQDGAFELPLEISSGGADRSLAGKVLLKVINVFSKKIAKGEVRKLAEKLEDKQLDGKIGLFSLSTDFRLHSFTPDNSTRPYLLLIHGTASSISGSFGEAQGTDFMNYIRDTYDGRILAFQHRTLTQNPLENVLDLIKSLPASCNLHLITTSRGGLVGEILSRFCNSQGVSGFNSTEISILRSGYPIDYFGKLDKLIDEIRKELSKKKIVIEKFIRIACPAGGTSLASKRLDYFLNITMNLIGMGTGLAANPLYGAFRNLTAAVIDCKNKPEILPGLEVQSPDSPFIKALNCTVDIDNPDGRVVINNSLVVISGNSKPGLKISALWIIASKLFFSGKNDLVVDTGVMALGTRRSGRVLQYFYEDTEINHFRYFKNRSTNQAILLALKTEWGEKIPWFSEETLSAAVASERNINIRPDGGQVFRDKITGTKPIVLLLPGIMGSNLEYDDNLLWINYLRIITGGLRSLRPENKVKPSSLVSTSYKRLIDALEETYDVVTFPYDWRMPLPDSAALLEKKIKELMKHGQPIKLIGHSMGGVLIRDFITLHRETWNKLNNSDGFRLIFLGAPLGGSYRIPSVLFGMDGLIDKLSMIDLRHTKKELLKIFSRFKGLLGLLPINGEYDFADRKTWQTMLEATDDRPWPLPSDADLKWFAEYRNRVKDALTEEDIKNAVYIAGRDKATPCSFRIENKISGKELVFLSTGEGDASVTWNSGIPEIISKQNKAYFVNVTHGELACHPQMTGGIKEILATGATNLFSNKRPLLRGEEILFKSPITRDFDLSLAGLDFSLFGIGGGIDLHMEQPPIKVSVSHGDLFYAKYPVLAGHFENDGILFAEKAIDNNLNGALSQRHRLGLYPGPIGSSEVFLNQQSGFKGAVIIGLGKPEDLTGSELAKSVAQGVSNYMLDLIKHNQLGDGNDADSDILGITSLIIGSNYGGLSVENSVKAIVQGVHIANGKLQGLGIENPPRIGHIEFVELYEDVAINALYSLSRLEMQDTRSAGILLEVKKIQTLLGSKKRIPNEVSSGWWNRITVKKESSDENNKGIECLKFNASTSSAHEKESELFTTPALIEGTIREMSTSNRWSPQSAKAIFELMIPNDFKEQLKRHGNINWILDYKTAEYPWELLQDNITDTKPLCVSSGMIRQLTSDKIRPVIKSSPDENALIIADPDLQGFASQLPGALKEGQKVSELLSSNGINTVTSFKGNPSEIIEKLFSNDYRIIHLSGHGEFKEDNPIGSGMVIGNNMFLSTREIKQMSTVPELVFVNCCHIGKISGAAEELYQNRYKLAANIGTQLIENGVRCVVAAGWAVDDSAALEFAEVFYNRMFDGYAFGDAILDARKAVFEKYGYTNTWGAYQCYGDPFYSFRQTQRGRSKPRTEYMIDQEAEIDLSNLLNELEIGNKSTDDYIGQLEAITEKVDRAKIRTSAITEKEALVYFELRDYKNACEKFGSLLNMEEATFSFTVAEKYYNAQAKLVIEEYRETEKQGLSDADRERFLQNLDKVISNLEGLIKLSPTAQRYNIMGSSYKRKAMISKGTKREDYSSAAGFYHQGYSNVQNWYSLTNWLSLESVLVITGARKWGGHAGSIALVPAYNLPTQGEALQMLDSTAASLCKVNERMSYWDMLAGINIGLCRYIIQYSENGDKKEYDSILKEISRLWKIAGSKGKRFAEIEHLEFLTDALEIEKNKSSETLKAKLVQLKTELKAQLNT